MKNTKLYIILALVLCPVQLMAVNRIDSLLKVLDYTIQNKAVYSQERDNEIQHLEEQIPTTENDEQLYHLYRALFSKYRNYNIDSALSVANKRLEISRKLNSQRRINTSKMNIADVLSTAGMYKETLDILNSIPRHTLEEDQFAYYYHLYHSIYALMINYSIIEEQKELYRQKASQYKDSTIIVSNPDDLDLQFIQAEGYMQAGNYESALAKMDSIFKTYEKEITKKAGLAYNISEFYHRAGNTELEKKFLIISTIADIQNANKEYISLRKLAAMLFQEGDIARAHTYIKCAMEDAINIKATFRTLETSEILPLIVSAYDTNMNEEKEKLYRQLIIISVLSVLLLLAIVLIYFQLSKIRSNRESIQRINEELSSTNEELTMLNEELQESNHIKEEYIAYVFNMCSNYINKLDNYRRDINKKLKQKQIDEALQMTSSYTLVPDEFREFYNNFDNVFIKLYPNFIEEFNQLLHKGEHIIPKEDEILTPELRIYALVKLGINDSTKIAKFLNYSSQTVYNYRLKTRNKSYLSKDEFLSAVRKIGIKH